VEEPRLIPGGLAVDERGRVGFVNDFHFAGVARAYTIENHTPGFVRAWHGHRREAKWAWCVRGAVLVCAVPLDWFKTRDPEVVQLYRFTLSEWQPAILHIPAGYANGAMSLTPRAKVVWFSSQRYGEDEDEYLPYPASVLRQVWKAGQP
jgi:dTDP-4-dehydrorhamnose 3,5-epimerase